MDGFSPILSTESMRAADSHTINNGVPAATLMENAGKATFQIIETQYGPVGGKHVVLLAGKGNNGGDGLVVARLLHQAGARVTIVSLATSTNSSPETRENLEKVNSLECLLVTVKSGKDLPQLDQPGLIVDALLGVGVESTLREPVRSLAAWANNQDVPIVSIDLPSGLSSSTGKASETCIHADSTVAVAALKLGHVLGVGPLVCGAVDVVDIGIPDTTIREHAVAFRAQDSWISKMLPVRPTGAHKYSSGQVTAIVGSRMFTGAAILSTIAAYRAGAGAVICCTPVSAQSAIDAHVAEVMVVGVSESPAGTLAKESAVDIAASCEKADAVLVGCGLGRASETKEVVHTLVETIDKPLVVDADGLHAVAENMTLLNNRASEEMILTPHMGEFLALIHSRTVPDDLLDAAASFAHTWSVTLVLKGMPSIVAAKDGTIHIGPEPNTALATAGTGDVLAGMITAYMAQGIDSVAASLCALHIGTASAERYVSCRGQSSMMAHDLLDEIPYALKERYHA